MSVMTSEQKARIAENHRLWLKRQPDSYHKAKAEYLRKLRKEQPERVASYVRKYRAKHPERTRAQAFISNSIRLGTLVRPEACEKCGTKGRITGHHHDYSKPKEIIWLCWDCHMAEHGKSRKI